MALRPPTDAGDPGENDLGPLVELARELRDGALGLDAAKEAARGYGVRGEVSPQQLAGMATAALEHAGKGQWRPALPVAQLSYEAARAAHTARPDDPALAEAWLSVSADLVEIFHRALVEQGDLRMYLHAAEIADETTEAGGRLGLPKMQGLIALRFGALVLDAYLAGRSPSNYQGQFDAWVARALQSNDPELKFLVSRKLGADGESEPGREPPSWPKPLDALDVAEKYLRSALPLVIPERRGRTLKALVQTLEGRGLLGGTTDDAELRTLAHQSLEELDPDDAQARLAIMGTLQRLGEAPEDDELVRSLEHDLAGFIAETDEGTAWDAVGQAASFVQSDPPRALSLLRRRREIRSAWADESLRAQHFEAELSLFARAYRPLGFQAAPGLDGAAEQATALAVAATSSAGAREAAAALISVMLAAVAADREGFALTLVDTLGKLDRTLWAEHEDALTFLVASLLRGEGVNHRRAGQVDEAGHYYRRAADKFRRSELSVPMVQCLEYLDDVVRSGMTELDELTAWLAAGSLEFELAAPSAAPSALRNLAAHVLAFQVSSGTSAEVVQLLLQVMKGRRFAAMLAHRTVDFQLDDFAAHLLRREAEAEAALPPDSDLLRAAPFDAGLGDDDLVTAWVDEYETGPSETPADRVTNLQRAVERHLAAALVPAAWPPVAGLDEIQRHLDGRTALLQLYEGPWVDDTLATWQLLLTRDFADVALCSEQMPHGLVHASLQGRTVTMPASGFYVGSLRRAVQSDPGPLDVSREGEGLLASAQERYLRVVDNNRDRLEAAGINRLVVVPHASSRYVPLHLIGPPGHPVADRWTVTYLSNLGQLVSNGAPAERREGVAIFALSYEDQPRLPRLDDSADEARAIADRCGTTPVLDEGATEAAFRRALEFCRYVHLRAHGRLYVDAPSFHTVFLHPADGDDGRLRAYEILPLDLNGLELVTLGACETALGRVDQSDNPRGLPAALLLAGAHSVVGTLWPVLASASTFFFTELYRTLMAADGAVTFAFAAAQRATKREYPQYRDWGAFYLIGGLSQEVA